MAIVNYSPETQLSGILTIICIIYALLIAGFVLYEAINKKQKLLFYFFFTIILIFTMWFVPVIAYIIWLFTSQDVPYYWHILGYNMLYPFGLFFWLYIYTTTMHIKYNKLILALFFTSIVILEVYMFYFLFFAQGAPVEELLGKVNELFVANQGLLLGFGLMYILIGVGTGIHFSWQAIKTGETEEIKWKGRFLLVAFISFFIQIFLDAIASPDALIIVIIDRILLIVTGTLWYLGFILPNWARKLLKL